MEMQQLCLLVAAPKKYPKSLEIRLFELGIHGFNEIFGESITKLKLLGSHVHMNLTVVWPWHQAQ